MAQGAGIKKEVGQSSGVVSTKIIVKRKFDFANAVIELSPEMRATKNGRRTKGE